MQEPENLFSWQKKIPLRGEENCTTKVLLRVIEIPGILNFVDILKHGCPRGLHDLPGNKNDTYVILK